MANSYGWNDDRRPYGDDAYDRDPRRSVYRQDRDDFGSSGPYAPNSRSEGRSYARDDWRYGEDRAIAPPPGDRDRQEDQARDRSYARRKDSRPVSDFAYGLGGGWDNEKTGAYLVADDGRYEQDRYGRNRDRGFGPSFGRGRRTA